MPAAAVASLTPAIAGISGTSVGASGETAVDMGTSESGYKWLSWPGLSRPSTPCLRSTELQDVDGRDKPGHDDGNYYWSRRSDSEFLLLRRRHLGFGGLHVLGCVRFGVGLRGLFRLVQALDLGGLAQLG